jgi:hypothetical protein
MKSGAQQQDIHPYHPAGNHKEMFASILRSRRWGIDPAGRSVQHRPRGPFARVVLPILRATAFPAGIGQLIILMQTDGAPGPDL